MSASIISLRSNINHLEAENERLTDELARWKDEAQTESLARRRANERSSQLEIDISAERIKEDILKRENIHLSLKVKRLTKRLGYSNNEVKKALLVLYNLSPAPMYTNEEEEDMVDQAL
jgi:predicted RNase H-like nuclease (RuvC/YqgF family)